MPRVLAPGGSRQVRGPDQHHGAVQDAARDSPEFVLLHAPWLGPLPALTQAQASMLWAGAAQLAVGPGALAGMGFSG